MRPIKGSPQENSTLYTRSNNDLIMLLEIQALDDQYRQTMLIRHIQTQPLLQFSDILTQQALSADEEVQQLIVKAREELDKQRTANLKEIESKSTQRAAIMDELFRKKEEAKKKSRGRQSLFEAGPELVFNFLSVFDKAVYVEAMSDDRFMVIGDNGTLEFWNNKTVDLNTLDKEKGNGAEEEKEEEKLIEDKGMKEEAVECADDDIVKEAIPNDVDWVEAAFETFAPSVETEQPSTEESVEQELIGAKDNNLPTQLMSSGDIIVPQAHQPDVEPTSDALREPTFQESLDIALKELKKSANATKPHFSLTDYISLHTGNITVFQKIDEIIDTVYYRSPYAPATTTTSKTVLNSAPTSKSAEDEALRPDYPLYSSLGIPILAPPSLFARRLEKRTAALEPSGSFRGHNMGSKPDISAVDSRINENLPPALTQPIAIATYRRKIYFIGNSAGEAKIFVLSEIETIEDVFSFQQKSDEEAKILASSKKRSGREDELELMEKNIVSEVNEIKLSLPPTSTDFLVSKTISNAPIILSTYHKPSSTLYTMISPPTRSEYSMVEKSTIDYHIVALHMPDMAEIWKCDVNTVETVAAHRSIKSVVQPFHSTGISGLTKHALSPITAMTFDDSFFSVFVALRTGSIVKLTYEEVVEREGKPTEKLSDGKGANEFVSPQTQSGAGNVQSGPPSRAGSGKPGEASSTIPNAVGKGRHGSALSRSEKEDGGPTSVSRPDSTVSQRGNSGASAAGTISRGEVVVNFICHSSGNDPKPKEELGQSQGNQKDNVDDFRNLVQILFLRYTLISDANIDSQPIRMHSFVHPELHQPTLLVSLYDGTLRGFTLEANRKGLLEGTEYFKFSFDEADEENSESIAKKDGGYHGIWTCLINVGDEVEMIVGYSAEGALVVIPTGWTRPLFEMRILSRSPAMISNPDPTKPRTSSRKNNTNNAPETAITNQVHTLDSSRGLVYVSGSREWSAISLRKLADFHARLRIEGTNGVAKQ